MVFLLSFANSQVFLKAPYLLYPGNNNQMTVIWQLDTTLSSVIQWGSTQTFGSSQVINEYGIDHQFKYTISGLNPGTKYYYKVDAGSIGITGTFITSPPELESNINFYIYADTRSHPEVQDNVTGRILMEIDSDPASQTFCLFAGDCVAHGNNENDWQHQFFDPLYQNSEILKASLPFIIARGNHENCDSSSNCGNATIFYKYWPYFFANGSSDGNDMYFSFDYGSIHVAVLDQYNTGTNNPAQLSDTQLTWLQSDLAYTTKPWKFILLHEPGWSAKNTSDKEHGNNADVQNNIQPLCIQYGVQAVFGGHNHYYAHCLVDGVHHFTLGGGGAPLYTPSNTSGGTVVYAEETFHFMKVEVSADSASLNVIRPDGSVVETIELHLPLNHFEDLGCNEKISIYPNPSTGIFTIEKHDFEEGIISVKSSAGEILLTTKVTSQKTKINMTNFSKGVYLTEILLGNKLYHNKIVLN